MVTYALLIIIYISFISLGLPDSMLGSAWPSIYTSLGVPVSAAGVISIIVSAGTVISSLNSERVIRRFGTGLTTAVSVLMTAVALLGISFSGNFALICLCAIPLGLGAGAVDAALNNYVALHYKATHMNWLHCFWGVGAALGPVAMGLCLSNNGSWQLGYRIISILQFCLVAVLFLTLPLWKNGESSEVREDTPSMKIIDLLKLPGAKAVTLSFFCYCAIESTVGLWGSSFLVIAKGVATDIAAQWVSLYYFGITMGRLLSGFISIRLSNQKIMRLGQSLIALGVVLLLLPLPNTALLAGLFLIGLGCAPIYPSLIHDTPRNFGREHSQGMIGIQMACAYVGTTLMPPLFGVIVAQISYDLLPFFVLLLLIVMITMVEALHRAVAKVN